MTRAENVAIIGGGPSGAVSLSVLVKEGIASITLFERKDGFGGTWRNDFSDDNLHVKSGVSEYESDPAVEIPDSVVALKDGETVLVPARHSGRRWVGSPALYPSLRTNVPECIMAFSDYPKFPWLDKPGQDQLTKREAIEQYLEDYVKRFEGEQGVKIHKSTSVEKVWKQDGVFHVIWKVAGGEKDGSDIWGKNEFDAVIVATGHYNVPKIPYVEGLDEIMSKYPGKVLHSKGFIPDEQWTGKKAIVVGTRSSSVDTVREIKKFTDDIVWSVRATNTAFTAHERVPGQTERKAVIKRYILNGDAISVVFEDGSIINDPDYVVYATGYHFSFPFLQEYLPNLTHDGLLINGLYQHTFLINDPLLSFVGTPIDGMSFRVFEYQAILVGRYLSGLVDLPSVEEQSQWHAQRMKEKGISRHFHSTVNDPALKYIDALVELGEVDESKLRGRHRFPVFSEHDLEEYEDNKAKLVNRWAAV